MQLPVRVLFSDAAFVQPEREIALVLAVLEIATALQSPLVVLAMVVVAEVDAVKVPVVGVPCGAPGG